MNCPNCGAENLFGAEICAKCGVSLTANKPVNYATPEVDKPNLGINLLSLCCIPILGIIMFFVWKDSKPTAAKSALIFGLCGIGIIVLWYVVLFAFGLMANITG